MKQTLLSFLACLLMASATAASAAQAAPDLRNYTSARIKTLQLESRVVSKNMAELKKIDGDFAWAYRIPSLTESYEQPGKLHYETVILGRHIFYTINGNRKMTVAPFVHKVQDISGAPGKKQTLLDTGVVPPEQLEDYTATFLRREGALLVYQLSPKQRGETMKDIIWLDPKTRITVKRENYDRDGKLTKWYLYKNPVQAAPGIYIPTRVEVYNPENKLAGVTANRNIRVNVPLAPSLFQIS